MGTFSLSPEQQAVVASRSAHLQVIACAGSGKTEAMACRVADLLRTGTPPQGIVAFTFTERAAAGLKARILQRCDGEPAGLYVGTIHAYCLRLLQRFAPECANFELLDEHRLAALLSRECRRLQLAKLASSRSQHWEPIGTFAHNAEAVENELIAESQLTGDFGECHRAYKQMLENYQFLTYGGLIARAVAKLQEAGVAAAVRAGLQHLIVDEYQDVNPAQESLIELLAAEPVSLCVVGDDDQAIYQWRGSDVGSTLKFAQRWGAEVQTLAVNRRSSAEIIATANGFVKTIAPRLAKEMRPSDKLEAGLKPQYWETATPANEAEGIAGIIQQMHAAGWRYGDVAILLRSVRTSAPPLRDALQQHGIPFRCAGRTGLFLQPEARLLGRLYAWLSGNEWKDERFGESQVVELADLEGTFRLSFPGCDRGALARLLAEWAKKAGDDRAYANLIRDYYQLLNVLGVQQWSTEDLVQAARLGVLARFSELLADFESIKRRAREVNGRRQGGQDGGQWFYRNLFNYIQHYALDAFEDSPGEADVTTDAVEIMTVHQAKGLEWPIVFLPCMVDKRFPSSRTGQSQTWLLREDVFPAKSRSRYEGSETDERRLLYVALTRAKDALFVSRFERANVNRSRRSRFLVDLEVLPCEPGSPRLPVVKPNSAREVATLALPFSDLAAYERCPKSYRFRSLGFQPELARELGYGRAVHSVLRRLSEMARESGRLPSEAEADGVLEQEFRLPYANLKQFETMKYAAGNLVRQYLRKYSGELLRTWDTERPFELRLQGCEVAGRADVILHAEGGPAQALELADYKTADDGDNGLHAFQLAIYAAAARAEGLDVRGAYLHHLDTGQREEVAVGPQETASAQARAQAIAAGIARRKFPPRAEKTTCGRCDVSPLCASAVT